MLKNNHFVMGVSFVVIVGAVFGWISVAIMIFGDKSCDCPELDSETVIDAILSD